MSEPTYRFELAKQGRALCQNSACKNAGVKIGKGEFRMGTLVMFEGHATWKWKHWGCVTPLQIGNLQEQVGPLDDLDLDDDLPRIIDGYDEIDDEAREKIKFALQNGHVPDEDWKGEPDWNRPGMKGINRRTPKKKPAPEDGEALDQDGQTPSKPKPKKGRGKKVKAESEDEEDVPAPKKKAAGKRKAKLEEEDDSAEKAAPPKRARKRRAAVKEEAEEDQVAEEKPTKRSSVKKVKLESDEEMAAVPAKRSGAKKPKAEERDDEDMADVPQPELQPAPAKRERLRKRKNKSSNIEEGKKDDKPPVLQNDGEIDDLPPVGMSPSIDPRASRRASRRPVKKKDVIKEEPEEDTHNAHEASATAERNPGATTRPTDEIDDEIIPNIKGDDREEEDDKPSFPAPDSASAAAIKTGAEAEAPAEPAVHSGLEEPNGGVGGADDERAGASKPAKAGKGKGARKTVKARWK